MLPVFIPRNAATKSAIMCHGLVLWQFAVESIITVQSHIRSRPLHQTQTGYRPSVTPKTANLESLLNSAAYGPNTGTDTEKCCCSPWHERERFRWPLWESLDRRKSNTTWLRDFLPKVLPRARILAYQCNANVVFKTSVAGIREQALNMLYCLYSERKARTCIKVIAIISAAGEVMFHILAYGATYLTKPLEIPKGFVC